MHCVPPPHKTGCPTKETSQHRLVHSCHRWHHQAPVFLQESLSSHNCGATFAIAQYWQYTYTYTGWGVTGD